MPNRINCPPPRHFCPFPQCGKPFTRKDQIIDLLDAATQKHDVISRFIIAAWNYLLDNSLRLWNPEIGHIETSPDLSSAIYTGILDGSQCLGTDSSSADTMVFSVQVSKEVGPGLHRSA